MKRILTAMTELITMTTVGKTDASNAEEQLARDSQLGRRRNDATIALQMWGCRISQDILEISPMPKKTYKKAPPKAAQYLTKDKKVS